MNILLISNGYPSKEIPFASIFVKNHYKKLKELPDLNVDRHIIKRKNTSLVGSIAKYLWCFISFAAKIPQQYDIVHVHFLSPIYLLACIYKLRNPRCRIIVTFHGTDINELSHPFWIQFYRFLFRYNDIAISVSEDLKRKAESLLSIQVDHVICAGYNDDIFVDQQIPYEERNIDFLYVGSFLPVKRLDTIIEAIKKVDQTNIRFVFIGTGMFGDELRKLSSRYDVSVLESMPQRDLNRYYNSARFFILASRNEGFNISLLEANHCGVPVIVRNIPALKNQVTEGKNGFLFNNEQELAELITTCYQLSSKEWGYLSEQGKKSSESYSLTAVIETMYSIYVQR